MPSSSDRSTWVELRVFDQYCLSFTRLYHAERSDDCWLLTEEFGKLLDMDPITLQDMILPPRHPANKHERDIEERWEKLRHEAYKVKRSERVWDAACCCAQVSTNLASAGRSSEAEEWSAMGVELEKLAVSVQEEERYDYYH